MVQYVSSSGQAHPTPGAIQQRGTHLLFKTLYLLRKRRLRDEQRLRRPCETAFTRDRTQVAQLPEFHFISPAYPYHLFYLLDS